MAGQPRRRAREDRDRHADRLAARRLYGLLADAATISFSRLGAANYLMKVAEQAPGAYLAFLKEFIPKAKPADEDVGEFRFVIQQVVVSSEPVPGVLSSPVVQHVSNAPRLVASGGEVIENEAPDASR